VRDLLARAEKFIAWFRATRDRPETRDLVLLLVRAGLAWIFIYHGAGTLFGAFHQAGVHGETVYFQANHLKPAEFFAYVDGLTQFIGGILIAVGIFGRLAGLALAGDMIGAMVTITFSQGLVGPNGLGYQLNLALIISSLVIAFLGTGRISLDEVLRRKFSGSVVIGPKGADPTGSRRSPPSPSPLD
jgi:putative oxidoreductase